MGFVSSTTSLKELNLSKGSFTADMIVDIISNWKNVQKLDVSDSELKDKGAIMNEIYVLIS